MRKRPVSITIFSIVFIAVGLAGLAYHWTEINFSRPFESDVLLGTLVRLLAIVSGIYMLRGRNWARWLAMVWISYHVILATVHSVSQVTMHLLVFAVFACVLFRRAASDYFRSSQKADDLKASTANR